MVKATLKWQKQKFDVVIDPSSSVQEFKASIFSLTGVPVDRQKLTCPKAWKGQLNDTVNFADCKLKEGLSVMLIGSAEVVAAQAPKVLFVEDMKEEEAAAISLPVGFDNLGNTCYMNSTLQCLRFIPELQEGLRSYSHSQSGASGAAASADGGMIITRSLHQTYEGMSKTTKPFQPHAFWASLKQVFPQFGERTAQGFPMQQDAEELYTSLVSVLASTLREPSGLPSLGGADNLVDAIFGMEMEDRTTCDESPDEPEIVKKELVRKLVCNIQGGGGSTTNVDHLHEGVKIGLTGSIEKQSELLGRNALWSKTSRINRLPRYLCVQFMRFYVKEARVLEEGREVTKQQKCKIMRPVSFPEVLDVYDFCSPRVQAILKRNRDRHGDEILGSLKQSGDNAAAGEKMEDDGAAATPSASAEGAASSAAASGSAGEQDTNAMEQDEEDLQKALQMSMEPEAASASEVETVGPGIPPDFQGNFELFGIVTHKGRFADGGHYMGWVRQEGDDWLLFDDQDVTPCKTEHVLPLKGGGDSDMAYLAFYRFKN